MFTNAHKSLAVTLVLGLSTIFLGFGWSVTGIGQMHDGGGPSISSPDTADRGDEMLVEAASEESGLRIVVTDADGNEIYNSDEDGGAQEQPGADGSGATLAAAIQIPASAAGPLTITAQDASGSTVSKTVTLN